MAAGIAGVALAATTGQAAASAPVVLMRTQAPITAIDANSTWLGLRRDRRTLTAAPGCVTVIDRRRWTTGAITNVFRCSHKVQGESAGFALGRSSVAWITGAFSF